MNDKWCDGGCAPDECVCVSTTLLAAYEALREENERLKNDVAGFASCNRARQAAEAKLAAMQKVVDAAKLTIKSFDDVDKSKCRACGEDFTSSYTAWFELEKLKELVEEEK